MGPKEALNRQIGHCIKGGHLLIGACAEHERQPMVKQRREPKGARSRIAQHFQVGAMPVPIKDEIIHNHRLPNLLRPPHAHAKLYRRLGASAFELIVSI